MGCWKVCREETLYVEKIKYPLIIILILKYIFNKHDIMYLWNRVFLCYSLSLCFRRWEGIGIYWNVLDDVKWGGYIKDVLCNIISVVQQPLLRLGKPLLLTQYICLNMEGYKKHKCIYCDYTSDQSNNMKRHVMKKHPENSPTPIDGVREHSVKKNRLYLGISPNLRTPPLPPFIWAPSWRNLM